MQFANWVSRYVIIFMEECLMQENVVINAQNYADFSNIIPYIRYCAEDRYNLAWHLQKRKIHEYEFIFITSGTGQFKIEDKVLEVKANDLILLKPNVLHEADSIKLPFSFLCIHFDLYVPKSISLLLRDNEGVYDLIPSRQLDYKKAILDFPDYTYVSDASYIHQLIKRIIHEKKTKCKGYKTVIKSLFVNVIIDLFRQYGKAAEQDTMTPAIQAIVDYIKKNYMHNIKLSEIAEHIHLEPSYISSLFKKHSGFTVTEYIRMHRIGIAKELLLETDRKVEDIAHSTGFYDIQHFSKQFKEYEGITPSQYRSIKLM